MARATQTIRLVPYAGHEGTGEHKSYPKHIDIGEGDMPKIESGIPVMNRKGLRQRVLARMKMGDSILCRSKSEYFCFMTAIQTFRKLNKKRAFHYCSHKVDGGYRIWRVPYNPEDKRGKKWLARQKVYV